jgi:membrane protein
VTTPWTRSERVMAVRRRHRVVDLVVEVLDGWRRHLTGRSAAVITYYGFLSVFPLFMVASTVLAIVLRNDEELRERILDTIVAQIPIIGNEILASAGELSGGAAEIVIGLAIALWASTKAFVGLHVSFDQIWDVPLDDREGAAAKRGKAVLGILVIGVGLLASTALSVMASLADIALVGRLLLLAGTATVSTLMLLVMYRYLTTASVQWREVVVGAVGCGIFYTALQTFGVLIIDRYLARSTSSVGAFATVFALMVWINLHAMGALAGAEVNVALHRQRGDRADVGAGAPDEDLVGATDDVPRTVDP